MPFAKSQTVERHSNLQGNSETLVNQYLQRYKYTVFAFSVILQENSKKLDNQHLQRYNNWNVCTFPVI